MNGKAVVKSIVRRSDATLCVSVTVSGECGSEIAEFIILDELISELDIEVGEDIGDLISHLDRGAGITAAYMSACASFAYTQGSLKGLYRKLLAKGFSKDVSLCAIDIVRSRGFVDETEIASRRTELMLSKHWGRARIVQKLREEGFPESAAEAVRLILDDVDFGERCAEVIKKKYGCVPPERGEREKMYASLMRLGYSSSDIRAAVRMLSE